jgi:thiosulfate/3-mercaptopyruvate sulfurtransferase
MRQVFMKTGAALITALGVLAAHAGMLPGPVVSTKWLAENLDKVQVVEVRSNVKSFTEKPEVETDAKTGKKTVTEVGGHIPNSRLVDMKNMRTERTYGDLKVKYMIPEKTVFEKAMQAAGVDTAKPMVLVAMGADATDLDDALRVYWQLKVYGEDDMAVLDGGMATWLLEGREHSTAAAPAKAGTWVAKADRSAQYFATSEDVAKAMADKSATLIDSRDARQYHGLSKRDYVGAYGHLEGAKLYGSDLMVNAASGTVKFMAANTYRGLMSAQGIDPAAPSIAYCNSGHLSSGPWFVASEILGNKSAKLYDGSLHQWTMEKRPVVGAVALN